MNLYGIMSLILISFFLLYKGQHVLSVQGLSKDQLNHIFNLAQTFRVCINKERPLEHILKVKAASSSTSSIQFK